MRKRFVLCLAVMLAVGPACNPAPPENQKLILVLVVDQMRADHITRFKGLYQHGFARLLKQGAVFTNAHHDHAYTVTAAGHATIGSGMFPTNNGIAGNEWFNRAEQRKTYCCEDKNAALLGYPDKPARKGRSPKQLLTSTLGDWLKAASPASKVYGVSCKDRSAILTTGKNADGAYWYHGADGNMVTSAYYAESYPQWVEAFNSARFVDAYFSTGWSQLKTDDSAYSLARPDACPVENDGINTTFPHKLALDSNKPDEDYYDNLAASPFMDEIILKFARTLIENEAIGQDDATDLLVVACSAADYIGHDYGPMSQESMDHFLRLDQYLGEFFDYLDKRFSKDAYTVVLTSDHGVIPIPEEMAKKNVDAVRVSKKQIQSMLTATLAQNPVIKGISEPMIIGSVGPNIFLNYAAAARQNISRDQLNKILVQSFKMNPYIEDVFTKEELARDSTDARPYIDKYRKSHHQDRSGDLVLRFKESCLIRDSAFGTTHGSPYEYDTHVPLIFMGKNVMAATFSENVRTVDIAPTLGEIVHAEPLQPVDGQSLLSSIWLSETAK